MSSQNRAIMRKLLSVLMIFLFAGLSAQQKSKVPLSLYLQTSGYPAGQFISILVEGDPAAIESSVKLYGGFMMHHEGTVCSVQLPCGQLQAFSNEPSVIRVGNSPIHQQVMNDTMKKQTGVLDVRNGLAPLPQGYTGAGVIMGIIDSGIDYHHPDFQDTAGNTRIYRIWDQRDQNGPGPMPWNYGTVWDSTSINNGTCTHNDMQYYGHGTHVCGIAGGNGNSVTQLDMSGVAPDVMFVVVALDFNGQFSATAIADAASYIYGIATSLNMPCIINASVGDYYGSHDGQDLQAMMIDTLLDTPGHLMVGAAGNAGDLPIHLSYTLSSDTNLTWFTAGSSGTYIQLWADTNNFNNAKFALGATRTSDYSDIARNAFTNMAGNLWVYNYDTLRNSSGQQIATILRYGSIQGSAYSMEMVITPDSVSPNYNFGLYTTGSGLFHCWSFDFYGGALPTAGQYPPIVYYKDADITHNIVSSFQCSDRVICVGNYVNRDQWPNYLGTVTHDTTVVAGTLMYNSSVGPTRDGRLKPEITAPGANDISCIETNAQAAILAGAPEACTPGGWHVQGGGTSAASPVVSGVAALWLERFPSATWQEYHDAVIWCAKRDSFTGNALPDTAWGYGKIDAWSMMVTCATSMDVQEPTSTEGMTIYPVPSTSGSETIIQLDAWTVSTNVEIFSASGQLVYTAVADHNGQVIIPAGILSAGLYCATTTSPSGRISRKFVVE